MINEITDLFEGGRRRSRKISPWLQVYRVRGITLSLSWISIRSAVCPFISYFVSSTYIYELVRAHVTSNCIYQTDFSGADLEKCLSASSFILLLPSNRLLFVSFSFNLYTPDLKSWRTIADLTSHTMVVRRSAYIIQRTLRPSALDNSTLRFNASRLVPKIPVTNRTAGCNLYDKCKSHRFFSTKRSFLFFSLFETTKTRDSS